MEELQAMSKDDLINLALKQAGIESSPPPKHHHHGVAQLSIGNPVVEKPLEFVPRGDLPVNYPPIWPHPASFSNGSSTFTVNPTGFKFSAHNPSPDLDNAFERYEKLFFPHRAQQAGLINAVVVIVDDVHVQLQLGVDESYVLDIAAGKDTITISAPTVYGAYHGLETLSQLISFNFDTQQYEIPLAPWHIEDKPRFSHREVLLDSSRHFEPVPTIKNLINSLTYAKINVIHWHIVDSQSFPFDSPSHPLLGQKGSYSPQVYARARMHGCKEYFLSCEL